MPIYSYDKYNHMINLLPGVNEKTIFIPIWGKEIESMLGLFDIKGNTLVDRLLLKYKYYVDQYSRQDIEAIEKIKKMQKECWVTGSFPADFNAGFNNLFIYTNIVQHSDVGNAFAPILTTVPNKLSQDGWGGSVHHEPKNLIYRPLQSRFFDTIEIDIKDDSGVPVPFKLGNVIIKLHFKKYD